jgi:hypothetical protein
VAHLVTRRLKDDKRASLITAKGMGLFAASTLRASNLSSDDIRDMISNDALNRFLVTFGGIKPIPLKDELTTTETDEVEIFAKEFAEMAKDKAYYFGTGAQGFYRDYHNKAAQDNQIISIEAVTLAFQFLDYLDRNHFEQIGLYAKSKSGKISPEQRVGDKIIKEPGI